MRPFVAAVLTSLFAFSAFPQGKLVETIEVRVANIDVVVRDRAGRPVTALTRDDFELFEDGVPQPITNLYEVRREAGVAGPSETDVPLELRQRRLVLFVDSASLHPSRKKPVLDAVQRFIDRMQPEDQAMLVSWCLRLQVVTPFTSDKAALKKGLAALARM